MSNASDKIREVHARRALVRDLAREEMSELGRDLFDLSREYENSGQELLTEKEIEVELARRKGGYVQEHAT
jgi:hypothetical protein